MPARSKQALARKKANRDAARNDAKPIDRVARALVKSRGNLRQAALKLKITRPELRAIVNKNPKVLAEALERAERRLDAAEATLLEALRSTDKATRLRAASHIVRRSARWAGN